MKWIETPFYSTLLPYCTYLYDSFNRFPLPVLGHPEPLHHPILPSINIKTTPKRIFQSSPQIVTIIERTPRTTKTPLRTTWFRILLKYILDKKSVTIFTHYTNFHWPRPVLPVQWEAPIRNPRCLRRRLIFIWLQWFFAALWQIPPKFPVPQKTIWYHSIILNINYPGHVRNSTTSKNQS